MYIYIYIDMYCILLLVEGQLAYQNRVFLNQAAAVVLVHPPPSRFSLPDMMCPKGAPLGGLGLLVE